MKALSLGSVGGAGDADRHQPQRDRFIYLFLLTKALKDAHSKTEGFRNWETPWWLQGSVEGPRKMALLFHPRWPRESTLGLESIKEKLRGFSEDPRDVGARVILKFGGHCAVNSPHVPLRFESSVFIYCLSSCVPLNGKSWEWGSENSAASRQPPIWVEGSNLLSIRCSVSQKGLTEQ